MFRPVCFVLLISFCWHMSFARHLTSSSNYRGLQHQPPYYLPYSDYGYTYSGPPPYPALYNQHFQQPYHSPMYSPPGTYYDQRRGILRPFPGGGVPVLVDYHKRCSNHYVGLKAHPDQKEYYYVCKPDCVIFGKCQNLQIFNNATGQCIQHPKPEYVPTCSTAGRFPLFSDCHLYYKCEEDLQPKIYSCPAFMIFSPVSKKCISGNKCVPTKISPHSSYMPDYCATKFPPCYENGTFRSPSDCSLYYKCDLQKDVVYVQTRFRCPSGQFYDLKKQECLPSQQVSCDCIQVAELVYPKNHNIPFRPPVFPAQFDFDSLEENLYPIEESQEEIFKNCAEIEPSKIIVPEDTTTLEPELIETTLVEELNEKDESAVEVLSDYVDMGEGKSESDEQQPTTTDSSEETAGLTEGSGNTDADSEEFTTPNVEESNSAVTEEDETVKEDITTENKIDSEELTDKPEALKEEPEVQTEKPLEEETTTTSTSSQPETSTSSQPETSTSSQPEPCKNEDDNENSLATDISDTHSQTQTHSCLPNLTTTTPNSDTDKTTNINLHETDFTRGSRSTIHDHNQTITTKQNPTITTQIPTTTITSTNTDHILEELTEKNNINDDLENNLLDTETSLETAETTTSSEKTTPVVQETTQRPFEGEKELREEEEENENLLDSKELEEEEGEELKEEEEEDNKNLLCPKQLEEGEGKEINREDDCENVNQEEGNKKKQESCSTKNEISKEPKHFEETSSNHNTDQESSTPPPCALIQTSTTLKPPSTETTDHNWDLTMDNDDFGLEDTKITLDDIDSTTLMPEEELENPFPSHNQENKTLDEKMVTLRAADFENEELLPVHSKSNILNELSTHTTDFDYITDNFDQDITNFIDDYTTISNDQEMTSTPSTNEDQKQTLMTQHSTALKRRETLSNEITLPPSTTTESPSPTKSLETQTTPLPELEDSNTNDWDSYEDDIGVLDSEVVLPSVEVSNNEITSAETSTAKQQFPHTHSTTITTTQTPTTTPQYTNINTTTTTTESCRKHLDSIDLHVRDDSPSISNTDSNSSFPPSSPQSKSLYYILKITAPNCLDNESDHIPRLEIIAERPIDVHFSICPSTCDKDHKHKLTPSSNRAVFLRWFSNKSKQTLGFETVNDVDEDVQAKDC
ncbi:mucin related 2B isoform 2-T2 [Cochliomyia hominivorax]